MNTKEKNHDPINVLIVFNNQYNCRASLQMKTQNCLTFPQLNKERCDFFMFNVFYI